MIQIRKGVFETNSSSTHSVSISYKNNKLLGPDSLIVDYDNFVHVSFGEFGWEIENYNYPYDKLQYVVTMLVEIEGRGITSVDELFKTDGFKLINTAVADYCDCDGIWIDSEMHESYYTSFNGQNVYYIGHEEGYIDHQSCEYGCVQEFLDYYGVNIIDFIFNPDVVVHTDNDNY